MHEFVFEYSPPLRPLADSADPLDSGADESGGVSMKGSSQVVPVELEEPLVRSQVLEDEVCAHGRKRAR